jgi:hypothetical protein
MGWARLQPSSQSGLARRDLRVCADLPSECDCYAWRVQPNRGSLSPVGARVLMPSVSVQKLSLFALTGMVVGSIVGSPPRTFGSVHSRYAEKRADTGATTIMGCVGVATLMVLVRMLPYAVFVSVRVTRLRGPATEGDGLCQIQRCVTPEGKRCGTGTIA